MCGRAFYRNQAPVKAVARQAVRMTRKPLAPGGSSKRRENPAGLTGPADDRRGDEAHWCDSPLPAPWGTTAQVGKLGNGLLASCKDRVKREHQLANILRGERDLGRLRARALRSASVDVGAFSILRKRRWHASIGPSIPDAYGKRQNLWSA